MNVIHVLNNLGDGGAEAFVMDLVVEAKLANNDDKMFPVSLLPSSSPTHQARLRELKEIGVQSYELYGSVAQQIRELTKIVRDGEVDVLHTHNLRAAVIAALTRLVCGRRNLKIAFTLHISKLKRWAIHKYVMRRFIDVYIAICEPSMVDIPSRLGDKHVPVLIPNGIPAFDAGSLVLRKDRRVNIAMVARFHSQKAHAEVIQAIALLRKKKKVLDRFHFWFIGDGVLKPDMEALVDGFELADFVTFVGVVYNARCALASFDAFLLYSHREGMPISALEARRAGLPIVANAVGAMPELIQDGVDGCLTPIEPDPCKLAESLAKLAEPAFLEALQSGAQARIGEYDIRECLHKHLRLYEQIAHTRK